MQMEVAEARRQLAAMKPKLGMTFAHSANGLRVTKVIEGANQPAWVAGLRVGDIIVTTNGHKCADKNNFFRAIRGVGPGQAAIVELTRGGETKKVTLHMGARDHDLDEVIRMRRVVDGKGEEEEDKTDESNNTKEAKAPVADSDPVSAAAPAAASSKAASKYPAHWGEPPMIQLMDYRPLPGGYGHGSSTLASWIQGNLDSDAAAAKAEAGGQAAAAPAPEQDKAGVSSGVAPEADDDDDDDEEEAEEGQQQKGVLDDCGTEAAAGADAPYDAEADQKWKEEQKQKMMERRQQREASQQEAAAQQQKGVLDDCGTEAAPGAADAPYDAEADQKWKEEQKQKMMERRQQREASQQEAAAQQQKGVLDDCGTEAAPGAADAPYDAEADQKWKEEQKQKMMERRQQREASQQEAAARKEATEARVAKLAAEADDKALAVHQAEKEAAEALREAREKRAAEEAAMAAVHAQTQALADRRRQQDEDWRAKLAADKAEKDKEVAARATSAADEVQRAIRERERAKQKALLERLEQERANAADKASQEAAKALEEAKQQEGDMMKAAPGQDKAGVSTGVAPDDDDDDDDDEGRYSEVTGPEAMRLLKTLRPSIGLSFLGAGTHLRVTGVTQGLAAAKAGLQRDDEIHAVNSVPCTCQLDFFKAIRGLQPGDAVPLRVTRDGTAPRPMTLTLGARDHADEEVALLRRKARDEQTKQGDAWNSSSSGLPEPIKELLRRGPRSVATPGATPGKAGQSGGAPLGESDDDEYDGEDEEKKEALAAKRAAVDQSQAMLAARQELASLRPLIGLAFLPNMSRDGEGAPGLRVTAALTALPADLAGLQKDDLIYQVNDMSVAQNADFFRAIRGQQKPGDRVEVEYTRQGLPDKATIVIGASGYTAEEVEDLRRAAEGKAPVDRSHQGAMVDKAGVSSAGVAFDDDEEEDEEKESGPTASQVEKAKASLAALRPYIGIAFVPNPLENALEVTDVMPASPAHNAGLERGDLILTAGDVTTSHKGDFFQAVQGKVPGDSVPLLTRREGVEEERTLVLGARNMPAAQVQALRDVLDRAEEEASAAAAAKAAAAADGNDDEGAAQEVDDGTGRGSPEDRVRRLGDFCAAMEKDADEIKTGVDLLATHDLTPEERMARVLGFVTLQEQLAKSDVSLGRVLAGAGRNERRLAARAKLHSMTPLLGMACTATSVDVQGQGGVQHGLFVKKLKEGASAARGGVMMGDVLLAVDGRPVMDTDMYRDAIAHVHPGDEVTLTVYRDMGAETTKLELPVSVDAVEAPPAETQRLMVEAYLPDAEEEEKEKEEEEKVEEPVEEEKEPEPAVPATRPDLRPLEAELAPTRVQEYMDITAYLGMMVTLKKTNDDNPKGSRLFITRVTGPAEACGLRAGDRLLRVNRVRINDQESFRGLAATLRAGQRIPVEILRDESAQSTVMMTVGGRESNSKFGMGASEVAAWREKGYSREQEAADAQACMDSTRPTLGISLYDAEDSSGHTCVYVDRVLPGGAVDRAGLKEGDRLAAVGGTRVNGVRDMGDALQAVGYRPMVPIPFEIHRGGDGEPERVDVVPGADGFTDEEWAELKALAEQDLTTPTYAASSVPTWQASELALARLQGLTPTLGVRLTEDTDGGRKRSTNASCVVTAVQVGQAVDAAGTIKEGSRLRDAWKVGERRNERRTDPHKELRSNITRKELVAWVQSLQAGDEVMVEVEDPAVDELTDEKTWVNTREVPLTLGGKGVSLAQVRALVSLGKREAGVSHTGTVAALEEEVKRLFAGVLAGMKQPLGMRAANISKDVRARRAERGDADPSTGIQITSVSAGGLSQEAGIQQGDIITAINDEPLQSKKHIPPISTGHEYKLTVLRENRETGDAATLFVPLFVKPSGHTIEYIQTLKKLAEGTPAKGDHNLILEALSTRHASKTSVVLAAMRDDPFALLNDLPADLGMTVQEGDFGLEVRNVQLGGSAHLAGVAPGDYLVSMRGQRWLTKAELDMPDDYYTELMRVNAGDFVELTLVRRHEEEGGENEKKTLTLFARAKGFSVRDIRTLAKACLNDPRRLYRDAKGALGLVLSRPLTIMFKTGDVHGVKVKACVENGPAEKAGVRADDLITRVNGKPVRDKLEFVKASRAGPAQPVHLTLRSKDDFGGVWTEPREVTLIIGAKGMTMEQAVALREQAQAKHVEAYTRKLQRSPCSALLTQGIDIYRYNEDGSKHHGSKFIRLAPLEMNNLNSLEWFDPRSGHDHDLELVLLNDLSNVYVGGSPEFARNLNAGGKKAVSLIGRDGTELHFVVKGDQVSRDAWVQGLHMHINAPWQAKGVQWEK